MEDQKDTVKTTESKTEPTYTKLGLKNDSSFTNVDRDIMNIVLEDGKEYTLAAAKQQLKSLRRESNGWRYMESPKQGTPWCLYQR